MKIYHVETRKDYYSLMIELEEKGHKWLSGYKPTSKKYWEQEKENTCIIISSKYITFMNIEQSKKQHPNIPIIEYKAKGENMTQENKHNLQKIAFDVSVAIESFARDISESEADLQEAKSSAKKLIEKVDEYLESLKPKFKVGDYVTDTSDDNHFICKIEKFEGNDISGIWYCVSKKLFFDKLAGLPVSNSRLSTPEEIAEYEAALTFHKHGRKPFEVKDGDILRDDKGNILISDDNIFSADSPKNLKKEYFISGRYTFLKTVEEVNEWVGADDDK